MSVKLSPGCLVAALIALIVPAAPLFAQSTDADTAPVRAGAPPLPGTPAVPSGASSPSPNQAPAAAVTIPAQPPASTPSVPAPAAPLDAIGQAYVKGLQRSLPAHGYRPGPETGRLDPATIAAILAYQRDAGLPQSVQSDMALKATIDSVSFAQPPIRAGHPVAGKVPVVLPAAAPSSTVAWVQQRLDAKGYDAGQPDGRMGQRTATAIAAFQQASGMAPDGRIGQPLIDALQR